MKAFSTHVVFALLFCLTGCVSPSSSSARKASAYLPPIELRSTPTIALGGSHWKVEFPRVSFSHAEFDFLPDGTVNAKIDDGDSRLAWDHYRGTWAQDGNRVVTLVNGRSLYDGTVSGTTIEGTVSSVEGGRTTPFVARTGSALAKFEKEVDAAFAQGMGRMIEDSGRFLNKILAEGARAPSQAPDTSTSGSTDFVDMNVTYDKLAGSYATSGTSTIHARSSNHEYSFTYDFDSGSGHYLIPVGGDLAGKTINVKFVGDTPVSIKSSYGRVNVSRWSRQ